MVYRKWIREIYEIVKKEQPDVVHFLYGDLFYRFFGYGLRWFRKYRTVVTLHWTRTGKLGMISTNMVCKNADRVVVHTEYIKNLFIQNKIKNAVHIEYPQFECKKIETETAKNFWGLSACPPVIGCIGGTRHDKGLDILLNALQDVTQPFQLLIAGKEETFTKDYIENKTKAYADKVVARLKYLEDEELAMALNASDIIVLPYRKIFDGASGPLGEGTWLGKCIIGPNHKSLGEIISRNHLGFVFESENIASLKETLEKALEEEFVVDKTYETYQESLNPIFFVNKYMLLYDEILRKNR